MEGRLISNKKNGSKKTLNTDTIYAGDSAKILKDKTIAFKNTRLWLSWLNEEVFHLAACEHIQKRRHLKGTFIAGLNPLSEKTVCLECLQLLKFDGLDARRSRRLDLAETIQKDFKLADFQKEYPFYPLI